MTPLPMADALDAITIPVACPVSWDAMYGDHRTRFCNTCSQDVHDLSELTRAEAVQLVTGGVQIPCLRLFRRPDGRVMTADCMNKRERTRGTGYTAARHGLLLYSRSCSSAARKSKRQRACRVRTR